MRKLFASILGDILEVLVQKGGSWWKKRVSQTVLFCELGIFRHWMVFGRAFPRERWQVFGVLLAYGGDPMGTRFSVFF